MAALHGDARDEALGELALKGLLEAEDGALDDASSTTRQTDESADACVTMTTCTSYLCSAPKMRDARSGTADVPVPSTVTMATLSTEVMPRMGDSSPERRSDSATRLTSASTFAFRHASDESKRPSARPSMTVPGCAGLKTLRT